MSEEFRSEFEQYRIGRLNSYQEDNMSAHYSNNESYPGFSDRPQSNSALSVPRESTDKNQHELSQQQRHNKELSLKYTALQQEHRLLKEKYSILEQKLKQSQSQNNRLIEQLSQQKEKTRGTKGKLKQWVNLAKQNLNQM